MQHRNGCRPIEDVGIDRDRSREDMENDAARDYHDEMAKLNRIIDYRKESIE